MNMHGFMVPEEQKHEAPPSALQLVVGWIKQYRSFLLVVVLPTLLVAGYFYLIAADQYESEAHFLVRSANQTQAAGIGISQALSAATGISSAQGEAISVADYLSSHDVVDALQSHGDLVARFQRPEADFLSRLRGSNPSPERLLKYFRSRVDVKYNTETGITTLTVHTFRPEDSFILAQQLLKLGEDRVNVLNLRNFRDSIATSSRELAQTEIALEKLQGQLTHFRQSRKDIDPQAAGQAQIELVSRMTNDLSTARAQLAAMGHMIRHDSPQYLALASHVSALEAQVGAQSAKLTGDHDAIATDIGGYEDLRMRKDFLTRRYEAAAAGLDKAREQAQRQQLYIVRIVEPNHPVKALFPQRARIVATTLIGLLLVYALGWLVVAGTREHAA